MYTGTQLLQLEPDQIPLSVHKVWWLRETTQIEETIHTPICEKSFKTQHGRFPIDPAILAAIGHRFIAPPKKENLKC